MMQARAASARAVRPAPSSPGERVAAKRRFALAVAVSLAFLSAACRSPDLKPGQTGTAVDLPDHQIAFILPLGWSVQLSEKKYYQLSARADAAAYSASIEYRGLTTDLTDKGLKDQYARGWYNAMSKNYPNWKYTHRHEAVIDGIATYTFEGTFNEGDLVLKKVGTLRFVDRKIHAIYFTAALGEFKKYTPLFEAVDRQIRYLN